MKYPLPPLHYKTIDEYAKRIMEECGCDITPSKMFDIKCLIIDCTNGILDKECIII